MWELPKSNQDLAYILGGGAASVLLFLLGPAFFPVLMGLMNFAPLPLLFLGLGENDGHQFYASALAVLLVAAFSSLQVASFFLMISVLPAFLVSYFALMCRKGKDGKVFWYPLGGLITHLTTYNMGLCFLLFIFFSRSPSTLLLKDQWMTLGPETLQAQYRYIADLLIRFLPALMTSAAFLTTLLNAGIAQGVLVKLKKNQRPTPSLSEIELAWWLWIALAACGVMALLTSGGMRDLWMNETLVLGIAFFFQGLSVMQLILNHYFPGKMFHWIFYVGMIVFGWLILMVMMLGVFEPWVKLRKRFTEK